MQNFISAMLLVAAAIHLMPLAGLLGPKHLSRLYGIPFDEPNLAILMRHRAILLGVLGLFLAYAAFQPQLRVAAYVVGFISIVSFLYLASTVGGYNPLLARVVLADAVALTCLLAAIGVHIYSMSPQP